MKADKSDLSLRRDAHDYSEMPLKVTGRSYRRFSRWLDAGLERLVARWAHTAAPGRLRSPRFRFRTPKPK